MAIVPLVGRDADVLRVVGLLEAGAQLITLCGPGGVGKTRLARALLPPSVVAGYADTAFCDLGAVSDREGIVAAVADALALRIDRGDVEYVIDQLGHALAARGHIVVVLDHVDAVVADASAILARWLAAAPEVTFVATARAPLRVGAELVYDVRPLEPSAACELYASCMRASGREARADDDPALAAAAERLDGHPLAIELAAPHEPLAQAPAQPLAGNDGLRTLGAALDAAWRALPGELQPVLARCGVFADGFTLAAAEAVVEATGRTVDALRELTRRALVQTTDRGQVRYRLLAEVRDLALRRLAERGDEPATRTRHARFFAELAGAFADGLAGHDAAVVGSLVAAERANILAAFRHARTTDPRLAAQLALAIEPFLLTRGSAGQLARIHAAALAAPDLDDATRARLFRGRALAHERLAERDRALADHEEAVTAARRSSAATDDGARLLASVLCASGRFQLDHAARDVAIAQLDEALELARRAEDEALVGEALAHRGAVAWREGKLLAADDYYAQGLTLVVETGEIALEERMLEERAALAHELGDRELHDACVREARELAGALGDRRTASILAVQLALEAEAAGRPVEADRLFAHALVGIRDAGDREAEGRCLAEMGWIDQQRDGIVAGRAHLDSARTLLDAAGGARWNGLVRASLAAIAAAEGRFDDARTLIVAAERAFAGAADPRAHDAAKLHYAHVDLALARRARAAGDAAKADKHLARVRTRLEREPTDPDSQRAAIRHARALVDRALLALDQPDAPDPPASSASRNGAADGGAQAERDAAAKSDANGAARDGAAQNERAANGHGDAERSGAARGAERSGVARGVDRSGVARERSARGTGAPARGEGEGEGEGDPGADREDAPVEIPIDALALARDTIAFRAPHGEWIDLSRRKRLRRILAALVDAPGELSAEEILRAAWPGERLARAAATMRVELVIATLRRFGLTDMLRETPTGYALDNGVAVVRDIEVEIT